MNAKPPLVVDLDGSLLRSDSLDESLVALLPHPWLFAGAAWRWARGGRAALKSYVAARAHLDPELLPINQEVLRFVRAAHAGGQTVVLATGADARVAEGITRRFPEIDRYLASDGTTNLTSERKAERLVREFGESGFDYIGNSREDRAVWRHANRSYLVRRRAGDRAVPGWATGTSYAGTLAEDGRAPWRIWLRQLRIHQSAKNLLLFLPLLAAHIFNDLAVVFLVLVGFVAFSLFASSVYVVNDLVDLRADRVHESKSRRPLAAGHLRPLHALGVAALLAAIAVAIAVAIGPGFALVLAAYAVLTWSYSFWLKRIALIDVLVLAMLYMIRIYAGAVIADVELSFWFIGVTLFLFLSLALVKRYAELNRPADGGRDALPGRGYRLSDIAVVLPLGIATGVAVLVLLAIYIQTETISELYPSGAILWLAIPVTFYWIGNIWMQAGRGAMHEDPVVFALRNPASLVAGIIIVILFVAASTPVVAWAETTLQNITVTHG